MKAQCDAYEAKKTEVSQETTNQNIMNFAPGEDIHTYLLRVSNAVCGHMSHTFDCSMCENGGLADENGGLGGWSHSGSGTGEDCDHVRENHGMLADLECHSKLCTDATTLYNTLTVQCAADDQAWVDQREDCD